jgi:site-specific recombinase XerD
MSYANSISQPSGKESLVRLEESPMKPTRLAPDDPFRKQILELLEDFFIYRCQRGYSQQSIRSYYTALADFFAFTGDADIRTITVPQIREWLGHLMDRGAKPGTVSLRLYALRAFLDRAVLFGLVKVNVAKQLSMRRLSRPLPEFLSEEDVNKLVNDAAGMRDKAIIETIYATGCRVSELVGMDIEDIRWTDRTVKVLGKGSKERFVPLEMSAVKYLQDYLKGRTTGPVFLEAETYAVTQSQCGGVSLQGKGTSYATWYVYWRDVEKDNGRRAVHGRPIGKLSELPTREAARAAAEKYLESIPGALRKTPHVATRTPRPGQRISATTVRMILKKCAKQAGIRHIYPHMLRHTFATHLYENGADLLAIRDLLGHVNIQTTQIYTHCSFAHMRETMERCHPHWTLKKSATIAKGHARRRSGPE